MLSVCAHSLGKNAHCHKGTGIYAVKLHRNDIASRRDADATTLRAYQIGGSEPGE